MNKYINNSYPKTGWEDEVNINHFKLIELIFQNDKRYCDVCITLLSTEKIEAVVDLLNNEFGKLLSQERRYLIEQCLKFRHNKLLQIFN